MIFKESGNRFDCIKQDHNTGNKCYFGQILNIDFMWSFQPATGSFYGVESMAAITQMLVELNKGE